MTAGRLDTNSLYLTGELNNLGIEVTAKHVVGDDVQRLTRTIERALGDVKLVIVSGGLGPTEDDLTRDAVAQAIRRKLYLHQATLDTIQERFRLMNRKMPEMIRLT